jgi:transcriptional regulator with XRE-family HTH domain
MSAKRLGELVGVTSSQIANYESGARRIGAARLYAISLALRVPISFFFSEMIPQNPAQPDPNREVDKPAEEPAMRTILRLGQLAATITDPKIRDALRSLLRALPPFHHNRKE